MTDMVHASTVS